DGRDDPAADLADPLVGVVGDVEIALRVDGDVVGGVELRLGGRAAVSAERGDAVTGNRRDRPAAHLSDAVVAEVGDVEVVVGVDGDSPRVIELRRGRRPA